MRNLNHPNVWDGIGGDYLIKEYGKDNFVLFCQNLRDKKDLRRALCLVYPFSGLQDFGEAWQRYLKK